MDLISKAFNKVSLKKGYTVASINIHRLLKPTQQNPEDQHRKFTKITKSVPVVQLQALKFSQMAASHHHCSFWQPQITALEPAQLHFTFYCPNGGTVYSILYRRDASLGCAAAAQPLWITVIASDFQTCLTKSWWEWSVLSNVCV